VRVDSLDCDVGIEQLLGADFRLHGVPAVGTLRWVIEKRS
jgi:hypothetical protein